VFCWKSVYASHGRLSLHKGSKVFIVLDSLIPTMEDWMDNLMYQHWMEYSYFLDDIADATYKGEDIIPLINKGLQSYTAGAKHHAACDLASTLEAVFPVDYKGVFIYD
jgi:hypothetical protein